MGVAKQDLSGVFDADLKRKRSRQAAVLDKVFHVNHRGITFVTDVRLPEWTEVNVALQVPVAGTSKPRVIRCRAVVVQYEQRARRNGYEVALLFLDLPQRHVASLDLIPPALPPTSISIVR
jgi:hypothetical protein